MGRVASVCTVERVVGVADVKVSNSPGERLITYARGRCLGIVVYDPVASVAGLLHVMLPTGTIDEAKLREQPAMFVDSGVPLLFKECYKRGATKQGTQVSVAGGAFAGAREVDDRFQIGKRNIITPPRMSRALRVLIVDDSALVCRIVSDALSAREDIEVVGTASDPDVARERIAQLRPDVITLDIEMSRMDGLSFLSKLMQHFPLPVVVVSSLTPQNSETALRALALSAVEVIAKPGSSLAAGDVAEQLVRAVRAAAQARVVKRAAIIDGPSLPRRSAIASLNATSKIIALGAPTGGTQALEQVLRRFPADAPGTVIVQHMPEHFTLSFANRLDQMCAIRVQEAVDGDYIVRGLALVAPGGKHLVVQASGARWLVRVKDGPHVHHRRPAVDVLFHSVACSAGRNAVGALLTGMGVDGAKGLLAMRDAGAYTIAQNERTCVVYGMPREAIKLEAAVDVLPLDGIADALSSAVTVDHAWLARRSCARRSSSMSGVSRLRGRPATPRERKFGPSRQGGHPLRR